MSMLRTRSVLSKLSRTFKNLNIPINVRGDVNLPSRTTCRCRNASDLFYRKKSFHTSTLCCMFDEKGPGNDPKMKKLLAEIHSDFHSTDDKLLSSMEELKSLDLEVKDTDSDVKDTDGNGAGLSDGDMIVFESLDAEKHTVDTSEKGEFEDIYIDIDTDDIEFEEIYVKEVPISTERGETGVFEVEELVTVLRSDNAQDLCVIAVPPEINYVDHLVIASGKSTRHLRAMAEWINKLYKQKKGEGDPFASLAGKHTPDWIAIDLGNIALHLFLPDTRALYDLETLWTCGPEYDKEKRGEGELPADPLDALLHETAGWGGLQEGGDPGDPFDKFSGQSGPETQELEDYFPEYAGKPNR